MKRTIALSFALFIGAALSAQNAVDFTYTAGNGEVTITGYTGGVKSITIPERIDNLPVTAIEREAFAYNQLTGVIIPDSVTTIGRSAFDGNRLTSVGIGAGVTMSSDSPSFPGNMVQVYTSGGRRVGMYRSVGGGNTWRRQ